MPCLTVHSRRYGSQILELWARSPSVMEEPRVRSNSFDDFGPLAAADAAALELAARPRALGARNHANANYLSKGRAGQAGHLEFGHQHVGEGDGAASRAVPQSAAAAIAVNTAGEAAINHANGA